MRLHPASLTFAGLICLSSASGVTIVSTTGAIVGCASTGGESGAAGNGFVVQRQWTQTQGYTNVSIGAALQTFNATYTQVTAYLTTEVGPGTTAAQQVATATVTVPVVTGFTSSLTTLFTGLTLPPGTYHLVTFGDVNAPAGFPQCLSFSTSPTNVSDTGVSGVIDGQVRGVAAYPPATTFPSVFAPLDLITITGDPIAPPTIGKAFGLSQIPVGGTTSLTFTITNPSANTVSLNGVGFSDTLPSGLSVFSATNPCSSGSFNFIPAGPLTLSGLTLAPGASCALTAMVGGAVAGVKNNSVTVTSSTAGNGNTATASITVVGPPTISKAFGGPTVPLNGSTSLSFTITNPNATGLTGVSFSDTFPSGLVLATPPGGSSNCGGTFTPTAGATSLSLSGGTIAASGSCTISVSVTASTGGVQNNTTSAVSSNEGGNGTTSNTATVTVVDPPAIKKTFGAASIIFGTNTTLTFTIFNPNGTVSLTGVGFTDTLPSGLNVATPNGLTGSCGGGTITAVAGSSSVSLSGATLASSAGCTFSVSVMAVMGGTQNNSVSASSTNGGTSTTSTASIMVIVPAVSVSYAVNLKGGDSFINITNNGEFGVLTTQSGITAAVPGSLCANVFAFDPAEELLACCSCPVTPDGLVSLSAQKDLLSNSLYSNPPSSISITLVATIPVANSCVNAASTVNSAALAPGLTAWSTTLHSNTSTKTLAGTEFPFAAATMSPGELGRLAQTCAFVQQQGSNFGICNSCPGSGQ